TSVSAQFIGIGSPEFGCCSTGSFSGGRESYDDRATSFRGGTAATEHLCRMVRRAGRADCMGDAIAGKLCTGAQGLRRWLQVVALRFERRVPAGGIVRSLCLTTSRG